MEEKQKSARLKRKLSLLESYKSSFDGIYGKKVLFDLMKESGFLSPAHTVGDPYTTAYNDGKRSVLLFILKQLNTSTEDILNLIKQGEENERSAFKSDE
jgi:hypothetical protein